MNKASKKLAKEKIHNKKEEQLDNENNINIKALLN
jgi:hypothetical protein